MPPRLSSRSLTGHTRGTHRALDMVLKHIHHRFSECVMYLFLLNLDYNLKLEILGLVTFHTFPLKYARPEKMGNVPTVVAAIYRFEVSMPLRNQQEDTVSDSIHHCIGELSSEMCSNHPTGNR